MPKSRFAIAVRLPLVAKPLRGPFDCSSEAIEDIDLDADPLTWELFDVELTIPNDSQTLVFKLSGNNEHGPVYADRARLVFAASSQRY